MYCTTPKKRKSGEGLGLQLDRGDGDEIDVVDRELAVAVDEVDAAVAHAVDRRDVELHRAHIGLDGPGAAVQRALVGGTGVAHAQGDGGDGGPHRSAHR